MPVDRCACARAKSAPTSQGPVRVWRETQGRKGKSVTVIRGLALDGDALSALAKELRAACGAGGTAKDGVIEVQGDHCDRIVELLKPRFANVKRAGG